MSTSLNNELDRDSAEFKKRLTMVTIIVLSLGGIGGLWLGWKIQAAERADARLEANESTEKAQSGSANSQKTSGQAMTPPKKDHPPRAGD